MQKNQIISLVTARDELGTLVNEVYWGGKTIVIARKGKPLVKIVKLNEKEIAECINNFSEMENNS